MNVPLEISNIIQNMIRPKNVKYDAVIMDSTRSYNNQFEELTNKYIYEIASKVLKVFQKTKKLHFCFFLASQSHVNKPTLEIWYLSRKRRAVFDISADNRRHLEDVLIVLSSKYILIESEPM
jgi:hypothetical protein